MATQQDLYKQAEENVDKIVRYTNKRGILCLAAFLCLIMSYLSLLVFGLSKVPNAINYFLLTN